VNFLPDRGKRPREQSLTDALSRLRPKIVEEEIHNSPLWQVLHGKEPCIPIAGDFEIIGEPDESEQTTDLSGYGGIAIMNKFSPLGIHSEQASGVAMVNYPTDYTQDLSSAQFNYHILRPMKASLHHLLEGDSYRNDLKAPISFFNIGPSSGSSLKYLHSQSYAVPQTEGTLSYAYTRAFRSNSECLTCKIANEKVVHDHLGQEIDYERLTVWEDDFNRVIVPYAPFRTMGTRIIPKPHLSYIGEASDEYLQSLGKALTAADYLMNASIPSNRTPQPDRTIPFRQTPHVNQDFHMFIDIYPPFPILAAESADFLGLSPWSPWRIVERMRNVDLSVIEESLAIH
jgi:uncharacterized protein (DUF2132 family)